MRKLFWQMNVTLDGLMEGPHHELDYTAQFPDPDFDRYASEMLQSIDGILLGRRTYELFAGYWPSATGPDADRLNELPKTVFSRTLKSLQWNNSRVVSDNVIEEVERLKREPGKELALFGSADLGSTLVRLGLIDEIRMLVSPVILGNGTPMFQEIGRIVDLKLTKASTWSSGMVVLYYELLPTGSSEVNENKPVRVTALGTVRQRR
jgi:dihydrofolate reductase